MGVSLDGAVAALDDPQNARAGAALRTYLVASGGGDMVE